MKLSQKQLLSTNYRPDIDGLRAFAILPVVIFHAFPKVFRGGFIGVDIFFVISGFLISTIIFENLDKKTFSFTSFYARRIRRIFPSLLLILISSYLFGWWVLFSDEYKQLAKHITAGTAFVSNFILWGESGYFDNSAETKPLLHLWSLGIEEQFYVIWPFLLWVVWKCKFNLILITFAVIFISFCLNIFGIKTDSVGTFFSPQSRLWELASGSLLAWYLFYKSRNQLDLKGKSDSFLGLTLCRSPLKTSEQNHANIISFVGMLLLIYGFIHIKKEFIYPGTWALIPVIGTVLIILAGGMAWANRKILSNRLMVWFGLISFPLYLWHWPLLSFATILEGGLPDKKIRTLCVVISIFLAWLTAILIERPIRFGKESRVVILSILMAIMSFIGYFTYHMNGLPFRLKDQIALREIMANPWPKISTFDCTKYIPEFKGLEFNGGCELTKDSSPTIVFAGDSHSFHYKYGIWNNFKSEPALMISQAHCLPFSGDQFLIGECRKKFDALTDYLEKSSSVKTIVISGYWSFLMTGSFSEAGENWRTVREFNAERIASFKRNARTMLSKIIKSGKQVVLMKDVPDLNFNINNCYDIRPLRISLFRLNSDCSMNYQNYLERISPYDSVMEDLLKEFPEIKIYDPRHLFCSGTKCRASDDFLPYYFNGDHLNHYGADMVIKDLISKSDIDI